MPNKICNAESQSQNPVQDNPENPHKSAKTKKIRPSEEGRIFHMVGVAGFEPEMPNRKTVDIQGFFDFITFFHYIFESNSNADQSQANIPYSMKKCKGTSTTDAPFSFTAWTA